MRGENDIVVLSSLSRTQRYQIFQKIFANFRHHLQRYSFWLYKTEKFAAGLCVTEIAESERTRKMTSSNSGAAAAASSDDDDDEQQHLSEPEILEAVKDLVCEINVQKNTERGCGEFRPRQADGGVWAFWQEWFDQENLT